jgi:uncharacterized protein (UPF0335 family)
MTKLTSAQIHSIVDRIEKLKVERIDESKQNPDRIHQFKTEIKILNRAISEIFQLAENDLKLENKSKPGLGPSLSPKAA